MAYLWRHFEKIVWTSRIATSGAPILAVVYSLSLGLVATRVDNSIPVGVFQGGSIILFPLLLVIAFIGWKWDFVGGILSLVFGVFIYFAIQQAVGWPWWYKIPYFTFWAMFVAGGVLYLLGFSVRKFGS